MKAYVVFLLLGLGSGAVYAALGLGLVLVHRVSGVVHFAHGAVAMYVTYVYAELRTAGDLILPVVGIPGRVNLGSEVPFAVALAISLAVAAGMGLAMYLLAFRPLREGPALARVVVSVGLLAVLQAIAVLQFGTASRSMPAVLPAEPLHIAGEVLPRDRLYLAAVVLVMAAALWSVYRFTRFGLASRAAAEDQMTLSLLGHSPDRVAAFNWMVASVLAGVAGILVSPITALNPVTYTLLVVPALAAAVVGRMSSFTATVAAGLALGMAQSGILLMQDRFGWIPRGGVREAVPLLVIVVALALGAGRRDRSRTAGAPARLPRAGRARLSAVPVVPAVLAAAGGLFLLSSRYRLGLVTTMIGAIICLSLVVLTGWVGQISLAQMAFAGVAGFVLSKLSDAWGVPFPVAPVMAALCAAAVGAMVALPAVRARGVHLAVVTIAAAVAIEELVFKNPALTGGLGGTRVPAPRFAGVDLGIGGPGEFPRPVFGLLVLTVLVAVIAGVVRVRNAAFGRRMLAVRSNERAAAAAGVPVTATKMWAFALSAFIAGLGGALLAYSQERLSFGTFGVFVSLSYLAVTYAGGLGTVSGAVAGGLLVPGGLVFAMLDEAAGLGRYQLLITGVTVVALAVLHPDGIVPGLRRLVARDRAGP